MPYAVYFKDNYTASWNVEASSRVVQHVFDDSGAYVTAINGTDGIYPPSSDGLAGTAMYDGGMFFVASGGMVYRFPYNGVMESVAGPYTVATFQTATIVASHDGAYCYVLTSDRVYRWKAADFSTTYQMLPTNAPDGIDFLAESIYIAPADDGSCYVYAILGDLSGTAKAQMTFATTVAPMGASFVQNIVDAMPRATVYGPVFAEDTTTTFVLLNGSGSREVVGVALPTVDSPPGVSDTMFGCCGFPTLGFGFSGVAPTYAMIGRDNATTIAPDATALANSEFYVPGEQRISFGVHAGAYAHLPDASTGTEVAQYVYPVADGPTVTLLFPEDGTYLYDDVLGVLRYAPALTTYWKNHAGVTESA